MKYIGMLFLFWYSVCTLTAQQDHVYSVSKTETREFDAPKLSHLEINTERTDWIIKSWKESKVKMEITYSAKHADKGQAKKELEYLELLSQSRGKTFYIRSAVKIPNSRDKPQSSLALKIALYIPESMHLDINNKLGKVQIEDAISQGKINMELCHFYLLNSKFKGEINQKFGESHMIKSDFRGDIFLHRSMVHWQDMKGEFQVKGEAGKWQISPASDGLNMTIESTKSDISIYGHHLAGYRIDASGDHTQFSISDDLPSSRNSNGVHKIGSPKKNQNIIINNTLGNIQISKLP